MTTFPSHRTKINRAMRLAEIGENSATAEALLHALPECVIARVTGHELAALLDAMWKLSENSKAGLQAGVARDVGASDNDNILRHGNAP